MLNKPFVLLYLCIKMEAFVNLISHPFYRQIISKALATFQFGLKVHLQKVDVHHPPSTYLVCFADQSFPFGNGTC